MIYVKLVSFFCSICLTVAYLPLMPNRHSGAAVRLGAVSNDDVETFKKPELIASVAAKTGMTKKQSEDAIKAIVETIQEQVNMNKRVALPGFGAFTLRARAARNGRNPQTGELLKIPASKAPGFSASKAWKDMIKVPKA